VSGVQDLGYLVAGYGVTGAGIAWYRWRLYRRGERARLLVAAVTGRPSRARGAGR
jgi:hypothetical protein